MSLGNPTPVAGSNAANAASAATAPSSAGAGSNPFGGGLDGLSDALGSTGAQNLFGAEQPQWNNTPSAQPTNNIAAPIGGGAQAPPLNVAPPPPQNTTAPVAAPAPTSAQAPASVTAGSTISSMMQPITPAQQQAPPVDPTAFAPAATPQNQPAPAVPPSNPLSFVNGQVPQNAMQPLNPSSVTSFLGNPAGM